MIEYCPHGYSQQLIKQNLCNQCLVAKIIMMKKCLKALLEYTENKVNIMDDHHELLKPIAKSIRTVLHE